MNKMCLDVMKKGAIYWAVIIGPVLPVAAQTWKPVGKSPGAPVVVANMPCNSSTDTVGVTADRSALLTCQSGVWKIPKSEPLANCSLPWGGTIASGASVAAYASSSVPYDSSCTSETRSCNNGTLSGTYSNQSCYVQSPPAPANCSLPWGGTIASGVSVAAYASPSVPYGGSCTSETRSCSNGSLSGTYSYQSCYVQSPPAPVSCSLPWGGTIEHGQSVTAYASSNVPYGSSCDVQTRTCYNGSLSGWHSSSSCSVAPPPSYSWQTIQIDYWASPGDGSMGGSCPSVACYSPGATQACVTCTYVGAPSSTPYTCTTYWVRCQ